MSDFLARLLMQHHFSRGGARGTGRIFVFVFVPVYIEKESAHSAASRSVIRKMRRTLFRRNADEAPFWTWFIDNPRRPDAIHPH